METQGAPQSKISTSITLTLTSIWESKMRTCTIIRKFSLSNYTQLSRICIRTIYRSVTIVISLPTSSTGSSRSKKLTHAKTKWAPYSSFFLWTLSSSSKKMNSQTMLTLSAHSSKNLGFHWIISKLPRTLLTCLRESPLMEMLSVASLLSRKMRTI